GSMDLNSTFASGNVKSIDPERSLCEGGGQQGQRSLNRCPGKDFQHEVFVPTTTATFHGDALALGMLLQERQGEAIEPSKVLPQRLFSDPRLVLAKDHIENPMAGVFDTPVTPNGFGEQLHAHGQTADVVAD